MPRYQTDSKKLLEARLKSSKPSLAEAQRRAQAWIAAQTTLSCTRVLPHHSGGHVLKLIEQLAEVKPHSKAIREFQRRSK
jgi:hypothetical protein